QFNHGFALFVEQSQIAVIIYGPARNIFRRWKQTRTVFFDVEPVAARSSLAAEVEAADFVMVGIGKIPGADHRSRGGLRFGGRVVADLAAADLAPGDCPPEADPPLRLRGFAADRP